jgi:hypothetical protein
MRLELTDMEAVALHQALSTHLREIDMELVRTDKRTLQHELAEIYRQLDHIREKLERTPIEGDAEPAYG